MKQTIQIAVVAVVAFVVGTVVVAQAQSVSAQAGNAVGQRISNSGPGSPRDLGNEFEKRFSELFEDAQRARTHRIPASLSITPAGTARLTGAEITEIGSDGITVSVLGFTFNVNTGDANITGGGGSSSVSDLAEGDHVLVHGDYDAATQTITARVIHSKALQQAQVDRIKERIEKLMKRLRDLQGSNGDIEDDDNDADEDEDESDDNEDEEADNEDDEDDESEEQ